MKLEEKTYTKFQVECLLTEQAFRYENKLIALKRENEKLADKIASLKEEISGIKRKLASVSAGEKSGSFDPKRKIAEYIKANTENGFDLNEAYNVDDSELGEICKELGLTEE